MAIFKTTSIRRAGSSNTAITIDANNNAVLAGSIVTNSPMVFRNRVINGDMRVDQRANGTVTINSAAVNRFTVDRWQGAGETNDGVFTLALSSSAPSGFGYSLFANTTTADASVGADQRYLVQTRIEGYNIEDFAWGTSSAKPVTLSFWVRSSITGSFGGTIRNSGGARSFPFLYNVSTADTWEYKTINIPGDTSGTWLITNGVGLSINFSLGSGSNLAAEPGAWTASSAWTATGVTANHIGVVARNLFITGVQLELGNIATPFERRPYQTELAMCQRYYQQFQHVMDFAGQYVGYSPYVGRTLLVTMRGSITISVFNTSLVGGASSYVLIALSDYSTLTGYMQGTPSTGSNTFSGILRLSAEL